MGELINQVKTVVDGAIVDCSGMPVERPLTNVRARLG